MVAARHSFILAAVVSVSLAVAGLNTVASAAEPETNTYRPHASQPQSVARGLIVKTTTSAPTAGLLKAADAVAGRSVGLAKTHKLAGKVSTIDFDETVPASRAAKAAVVLTKRSDVVWAVPNTRRLSTAASPVPSDDPLFPAQRNLWDTKITNPVGGYSIKAPTLWRKTKGSPDIVVAVVDTGIRAEHPDLEGQLVPGYDMISVDPDLNGQHASNPSTYKLAGDGDGRDADASDPGDWTLKGQCGHYSDGQPYPAYPSSWHGTFVAGIIAAKANNGKFIAGVAPGVKVQPVRVLGHCGGWDSDIIAGITWASGGHVDGVADNPTPANVVNLSLGYTDPSETARAIDCLAYSDAATAGRSRGATFVASAGNDYGYADRAVPASCDGFISVGSTSYKGYRASYSNIGSSVDLSAPGGDTDVEGANDSVLSLVNSGLKTPVAGGSTYRRYEGTSMAAPQVSAAAALMYSSLPSPAQDLTTSATVQRALFASVEPFRGYSGSYAYKPIKFGTTTYYFELNCQRHHWCGRGILNLDKVQAPLSGATITGDLAVGETLRANPGTWTGKADSFQYTWFRNGVPFYESYSGYTLTQGDIGAKFSVRINPLPNYSSAFSAFSTTSAETAAVPDGPDVTITNLAPTATYGVAGSATVNVSDEGIPVDGPVELRLGDKVLASGNTVGGTVDLVIPGLAWAGGGDNIRAAFLGNGTDNPRSSYGTSVYVARAESKISHVLVPSTVKSTSQAKSTVTLEIAGVLPPAGLLKLYDGQHYMKTYTMSPSYNGVHTFTLPRITRLGGHSIKWRFLGNSNVLPKISGSKTLVVK